MTRARGVLLLAVLLAACLPSTGSAGAGVVSWVDVPAPETLLSADGLLAGWGFECYTGAATDRVDVWYQGDDGNFVPVQTPGAATLYPGLYRPDVRAAFAGACPNVTPWVGWHVYVHAPIPSGRRTLAINVWRGPYYQTHVRTVVIP